MATASDVLKLSQAPAKAASENIILETLKNLRRNRSAVAGMCIIGFLILLAIFAPQAATHDPYLQLYGQPGETPPLPRKPPCIPLFGCTGAPHAMGLDQNARDLYSRIVFGTRTSLVVGFSSVSLAIIFGTLIGLIAGYAGGWVDNIIMRTLDVVLAFPSLLLAITIVTIRGPGLENALMAIAIVSIPAYARLIRANVLSVKEMEYVTAVRSIGAH